jgi:hypothetical protein
LFVQILLAGGQLISGKPDKGLHGFPDIVSGANVTLDQHLEFMDNPTNAGGGGVGQGQVVIKLRAAVMTSADLRSTINCHPAVCFLVAFGYLIGSTHAAESLGDILEDFVDEVWDKGRRGLDCSSFELKFTP